MFVHMAFLPHDVSSGFGCIVPVLNQLQHAAFSPHGGVYDQNFFRTSFSSSYPLIFMLYFPRKTQKTGKMRMK